MTLVTLPAAQRRFSSPPTARRSRNAMSSKRPHALSKRRAQTRPRILALENPVVLAPAPNNARHWPPKPHKRAVRDPKSP
jgi:hypothetical protein